MPNHIAHNDPGCGPGARRGRAASLEVGENLLHVFYAQVLVELVVDLDHGRVDTGAEALHLRQREQPVLGRLAILQACRMVSGAVGQV